MIRQALVVYVIIENCRHCQSRLSTPSVLGLTRSGRCLLGYWPQAGFFLPPCSCPKARTLIYIVKQVVALPACRLDFIPSMSKADNIVWRFFQDKGSPCATCCLHCTWAEPKNSSFSTSNLWRHLETVHHMKTDVLKALPNSQAATLNSFGILP